MKSEAIEELLRRYAACICAGDREGIVALYASDASAEIPVGGPVHRGIEAIRRFYFENELARHVEITGPVCVAGREAAAAMRARIARDGGLVEIDVIDVVEVDAGGRIAKLRAFFDLARARRVETRS